MKNLNTFIATFTLLASINLAAKESSKNFNKEESFAEVCVTDPEGNTLCSGGNGVGEVMIEGGNIGIGGGIGIGNELPDHLKNDSGNTISVGAGISGDQGGVSVSLEWNANQDDKDTFKMPQRRAQRDAIQSRKSIDEQNLNALKKCAFPAAWEKAAAYREANGNMVKIVMGEDVMGDKGIYVYSDGDSEHRFYKIDETKKTQEIPVVLSKPQTEPVWVTIETDLTYGDSFISRLSRSSAHKEGLSGGIAVTIDPNKNSDFHKSLLSAAGTSWATRYFEMEAKPYLATARELAEAKACNEVARTFNDKPLVSATDLVLNSKNFSINKDSNQRKLAYKGEETAPRKPSNSRSVSAE